MTGGPGGHDGQHEAGRSKRESGQGGQGGPAGGQNPMAAALANVCPDLKAPFVALVKSLSASGKQAIEAAKSNQASTRAQQMSAIETIINNEPNQAAKDSFTALKAQISTCKQNVINAINQKVPDGASTIQQIQAVFDNEDLTNEQTCEQVVAAVQAAPQNVQKELMQMAGGHGGPSPPSGSGENHGPPTGAPPPSGPPPTGSPMHGTPAEICQRMQAHFSAPHVAGSAPAASA